MSGLEGPNSPLQWLSGPQGFEYQAPNSANSLGGARNRQLVGDPQWDEARPMSPNVEDRRGIMSFLSYLLAGSGHFGNSGLGQALAAHTDRQQVESTPPQMQTDFGVQDAGVVKPNVTNWSQPMKKQYRK